MSRSRTAVVAAIAVVLVIVAAVVVGEVVDSGSHPARDDPAAVRRELVKKWNGPKAEQVGADPTDSSARMQVAHELMDLGELPASTVRDILGRPLSRSSARRWEYVVSRRKPSDGLGGWCTRLLTIEFDLRNRVASMNRGGEECPRGLND
jgi:hypothetical protein